MQFQVDATWDIPDVGTVVGGLLTKGILTENTQLLLGKIFLNQSCMRQEACVWSSLSILWKSRSRTCELLSIVLCSELFLVLLVGRLY